MSGFMDPSEILNEEMVNLAIDLATESILRAFEVNEMVWGPKYLAIVVVHPTMIKPVERVIDPTTVWAGSWGDRDNFMRIAKWKAQTAQKYGKPTSELTLMCPWDLRPGDYLYPGGVVEGNLGVGCSGIEGFGDEASANTILAWIKGFSRQKFKLLRERKIGRLA